MTLFFSFSNVSELSFYAPLIFALNNTFGAISIALNDYSPNDDLGSLNMKGTLIGHTYDSDADTLDLSVSFADTPGNITIANCYNKGYIQNISLKRLFYGINGIPTPNVYQLLIVYELIPPLDPINF